MFDEMIMSTRRDVANFMMGINIRIGVSPEQLVQMRKARAAQMKTNAGGETASPITKKKEISRNAPCPCGSGKKYKQCCGK